MRFPAIKQVARYLRTVNRLHGPCDVRLQVYEDGGWAIRYGLSDYDQDHRGYWGASSLPGPRVRFSSLDLAKDLLDQAKDQHAMEQG